MLLIGELHLCPVDKYLIEAGHILSQGFADCVLSHRPLGDQCFHCVRQWETNNLFNLSACFSGLGLTNRE